MVPGDLHIARTNLEEEFSRLIWCHGPVQDLALAPAEWKWKTQDDKSKPFFDCSTSFGYKMSLQNIATPTRAFRKMGELGLTP